MLGGERRGGDNRGDKLRSGNESENLEFRPGTGRLEAGRVELSLATKGEGEREREGKERREIKEGESHNFKN